MDCSEILWLLRGDTRFLEGSIRYSIEGSLLDVKQEVYIEIGESGFTGPEKNLCLTMAGRVILWTGFSRSAFEQNGSIYMHQHGLDQVVGRIGGMLWTDVLSGANV